jgi:sialic acid synthase SpsE
MFIIAELFPQYGGDLDVAERMILECKLGGASAVKVQLYPADMFPGDDGVSRSYLELSRDGLKRLKDYADRVGIDLFATPFTEERLRWCTDLDLRYLKVASRMHTESPALVEAILATGKPTFVSVPAERGLDQVVQAENATYLCCVGKYPTRLDEVHVPEFAPGGFAGISDHSIGIAAVLFAAAHGATVVEKHYTISKAWQRPTEKAHLGSMTLDDLRTIVGLSSELELVAAANPPGSRRST